MRIYDLVDDTAMGAVCCHGFRGRPSTDDTTEEDILKALRRKAGMLDTAPSVLEFKNAVKDVARMKPVLSVVERIYEAKMGVADLVNMN